MSAQQSTEYRGNRPPSNRPCPECFGTHRVFTTRAGAGGEIAEYAWCPLCRPGRSRSNLELLLALSIARHNRNH